MDISQENLDSISQIYEIALDHASWGTALDRICAEAGAVAANGLLVDHTIPEIQVNAVSACFSAEDLAEFHTHHLEAEAPAIMALSKYKPGEFITREQIYSDIGKRPDEVSTTRWLRENFGIEQRIATRLNTDPAWLDGVTFHYASAHPPFGAVERARINLYRPHFARVVEITRPFTLLRSRFRAVLEVLDRFHIGTFILSDRGEVVVCNREAERILSLGDGLGKSPDGHLICHDEADGQALSAAIAAVCRTARAEDMETGALHTISRRSERDALLADVAPLRGSEAVLESGFRGGLVLVTDPGNPRAISSQGLTLLYALSDAEEAICRMVIEGLKNEQIAESRNVTLDTVRTQLKSLYAKTGTSHRIELVRLAQTVNIPVDEAMVPETKTDSE